MQASEKQLDLVICGGGIAGLAAGYVAKKRHPEWKIAILEKNHRLGGWIRTEKVDGFLFELGPRSLRSDPSVEALVAELGLPVVSPMQTKRYLYREGKLGQVRHTPSLFLKALWTNLWAEKGVGEESVYAFAKRRFGQEVADLVFDPLTVGVYAGNSRELSAQSSFPSFTHRDGHLLSLLLKRPKTSLYTFAEGMESLVKALENRLKNELIADCEVLERSPERLLTTQGSFRADRVWDARPPAGPKASVITVSVGYKNPVLPVEGFGHLTPSHEKNDLLGVVYDSSVFPQQNKRGETRLTVMLGGTIRPDLIHQTEAQLEAIALKGLREQLGITATPDAMLCHKAWHAIPQFYVGAPSPKRGVSVNEAIKWALNQGIETRGTAE